MTLSPEMMIILGAIGAWLAKTLWPWLRARLDADFRARREASKSGVEDRETRYLAAMEQFASASKQFADAAERISLALDVISKTRVADDMTLQRMERRLDELTRPRPRTTPRRAKEAM